MLHKSHICLVVQEMHARCILLPACSESDTRPPVEAAQLAALRRDMADADLRYRRLDEAHAITLSQLAAARAEATAATAAATGVPVCFQSAGWRQLMEEKCSLPTADGLASWN